MERENYDDSCNIIELVKQTIKLPQDFVPPIRVRLIRNQPNPAYRVTIIGNSTVKRNVKQKDGRNVLIFAGRYVVKQWWVDKTQDGLIFTPTLPEGDVSGNPEKN